MKQILKLFIISFLTMNCGSFLYAQDSLMERRVLELERHVENLNDSISLLQKSIIEENRLTEQSKAKLSEFIQSPGIFILKNGTLIIAITLVFGYLLLLALNKLAPKWYISLIQKWIEKYEETNLLKRNKKILVISDKDNFSNERYLVNFFKQMGFSKLQYTTLTKTRECLNDKTVDILFINNENQGLPQNDVEPWLTAGSSCAIIYFGKSGSWDFRRYGDQLPEFLQRMNFANSRAQLYGNLISTLQFHRTLI